MPGTGTGSSGGTASRMPITRKKSSQMASVFLWASAAKGRAIARRARPLPRGASTASKIKTSATPRSTHNSPGNCSIVSLLEKFISGKESSTQAASVKQRRLQDNRFLCREAFLPKDLSFNLDFCSAGVPCGDVRLGLFEKVGHFQTKVSCIGRVGHSGLELDHV